LAAANYPTVAHRPGTHRLLDESGDGDQKSEGENLPRRRHAEFQVEIGAERP
jgi:hypothetical protein